MRRARCTQKPANQLTTRILRRFGNEHQGPRKPWEGPPGPQNTSRGFPYESRTKSGHSYHQIRTLFTRKSRITPDTTKLATVSDSTLGSGPKLSRCDSRSRKRIATRERRAAMGPEPPPNSPKGGPNAVFYEVFATCPEASWGLWSDLPGAPQSPQGGLQGASLKPQTAPSKNLSGPSKNDQKTQKYTPKLEPFWIAIYKGLGRWASKLHIFIKIEPHVGAPRCGGTLKMGTPLPAALPPAPWPWLASPNSSLL